MITEKGRVVAIEASCLWVETIGKTSCGTCSIKKGCGHSLLNELGTGKRTHLRVMLNDQAPQSFSINDEVSISIPENVLVRAAFIMYIVPLISLLAGAILVSQWWQGDLFALLGAVVGFAVGIGLIKCHSFVNRDNREWQPAILPPHSSVIVSSS